MSWITEALFPRHCPVCRQIVPFGEMIHRECIPLMKLADGPRCMRCGRSLRTDAEYCSRCGSGGRSQDGGVIGFDYGNEAVRELISRVKYHNERQYLDYPCRLMAEQYRETVAGFEADMIVPVPVHRSRRRRRGFNQAEEIARRLAEVWELPVEKKALKRVHKTQPQKELNAQARLSNLLGAFEADAKRLPPGCRVILADDIYTTGSTLEACTQVLKRAGAAAVFTAVLAGVAEDGREKSKEILR